MNVTSTAMGKCSPSAYYGIFFGKDGKNGIAADHARGVRRPTLMMLNTLPTSRSPQESLASTP